MRVTTLVMCGAGYVLETKAGRERYAEIVTMAEKASERLEEFSAGDQPDAVDEPDAIVVADRNARWREAAR